MERRIDLETASGEKVCLILAEPERATEQIVILCHGFMSDQESSTNLGLTKRLLSKNIATARFDFFGHGKHPSSFQELTLSTCLAQTGRVIDWITENHYRKIGLLGSSYGGLVALHTTARRKEITVLGLKCPVSNYPPLWRDRFGESGLADWKETGRLSFMSFAGKCRLNYKFFEDLVTYNTYQDAATIKVPTLIMHGDADEDVPVSQSETLIEALRSERSLDKISGADHSFSKDKDFEGMVSRFESWFIQKLSATC